MAQHIFDTVTINREPVSVGTEPMRFTGAGDALVVRNVNTGALVMALPLAHVSAEILSAYFDATDTDAILSRLAESN